VNLPRHCRRAPACLDYRAFVFDLGTGWDASRLKRLRTALLSLGEVERSALQVVYVRGSWGFAIVPPPHFPDLKINFFYTTDRSMVEEILAAVGCWIEILAFSGD